MMQMGLTTLYKTSKDGDSPCRIEVGAPRKRLASTSCSLRSPQRPHDVWRPKTSPPRKNSRVSPSNNWYGPCSLARGAVQQRPGPRPGQKNWADKPQIRGSPSHNKLEHRGLPTDTHKSGLVPDSGRPPSLGTACRDINSIRRDSPRTMLLKHNTEEKKSSLSQRTSPCALVKQFVPMTIVMTYHTASSCATPRRRTSDSPFHSVHF